MKQYIVMMGMVLVLSGCGNKTDHSAKTQSMSKVTSLLNSRDYETAIVILEPLHLENPSDEMVATKLLHAYAGAGSFEALKIAGIWQEMESIMDDLKKTQKENAKKEILESTQELITKIEKILSPIPELSELQVKRLNQAIKLYNDLGLTVEKAGKYNNFKWAILHTYRLAINVKQIVISVKKSTVNSAKVDAKEIENIVMPKLKLMGQDLFMAYKLYSNSFEKIKKVTESIDKLLAKTLKDENFKLKISTIAKDEGEFFKNLINDNIQAASRLISLLSDIYQNDGHQDKVKGLLAKLPTEDELKQSQLRVEQLVKVFIDQFNQDHPEVEGKLKSIFTDQLKAEVLDAIKRSLKERNTDAIKELLVSKKPEVEVLKNYYLILKGDFEMSDLEEDLRAEVETMKKKVDLELMKAELKEIAEAFKKDTKIVEFGAQAMLDKDLEILKLRKESLEIEVNKIKDDLEGVTTELKESLIQVDVEEQKQKELLLEVKTLVEN